VSYDLAVWEGTPPASGLLGLREFRRLYDELFNTARHLPPAAQIQHYVTGLLTRWRDDGESEDGDGCPWVHRPLIASASGSLIYFSVRASRAVEVTQYAAELAAGVGLVCFDPQTGELR
jgi:hypothetical protein